MKRTRKWAFVAQEAQRLAALGLTPLEIAAQIGVRKSTVNRWFQSGKLTRAKRPVHRSANIPKAPAEWAKQVRADYALNSTDDQLVTLAQQALELAYNMAEQPSTRLAASARFQSIEKRLGLALRAGMGDQKPESSQDQKPAERPVIRRSGVDPRGVLQALK